MTSLSTPKATNRRWFILIPVASVMYLLAFFDRTNLSFVLPYMGEDLGLSNTDKGLVSGIFFIGYLLLQVPAALLAQRWSAKYTILILMICWGLAAIWTGLVRDTSELFLARFVLGFFEGGVQPATLVLLSKWFPQREKARASGFWLLCIPFAAIIAAPITGGLLSIVHWRTVLVLEGLPPLVWAIVWLFIIADRPSKARWLPSTERDTIEHALAEDEAIKKDTISGSVRYRDAIKNPKVIGLILAWFFYNAGFYGFTLWLPQVIKDLTGGTPAFVGFVTAIPYVVGLVFMIVISVRTDRHGSRRFTVLVPLTISALALLLGQFAGVTGLQFALLCVVAGGLYVHGAFFALPPLLLRTEILAVALGLIGGLGNLGGFVGPYVVGWLIDATGTPAAGFGLMAVSLLIAGICMATVTPRRVRQDPASTESPQAPAAGTRR
ncbi:MAG TPA: MFS transporter [Microlunatus sp.]